jgi:hypothetical protein
MEAEKAWRAAFPGETLPADDYDGSKINSVLDTIDRVQWAIMNSAECKKLVLNCLDGSDGAEEALDKAFPGLSKELECIPDYRREHVDKRQPLHVILYGMAMRNGLPEHFYDYFPPHDRY